MAPRARGATLFVSRNLVWGGGTRGPPALLCGSLAGRRSRWWGRETGTPAPLRPSGGPWRGGKKEVLNTSCVCLLHGLVERRQVGKGGQHNCPPRSATCATSTASHVVTAAPFSRARPSPPTAGAKPPPPPGAAMGFQALRTGFLTKRGGRVKTWKHRCVTESEWCCVPKVSIRAPRPLLACTPRDPLPERSAV